MYSFMLIKRPQNCQVGSSTQVLASRLYTCKIRYFTNVKHVYYICKMKDLGARLLAVMEFYNLSRTEFAARLGVSPAVLSHISSGRNKPGLEMVVELLNRFPEVSADWLLLDKGSMLREKIAQDEQTELCKLLNEVTLLNDVNYNSLRLRLEAIKGRLSAS